MAIILSIWCAAAACAKIDVFVDIFIGRRHIDASGPLVVPRALVGVAGRRFCGHTVIKWMNMLNLVILIVWQPQRWLI